MARKNENEEFMFGEEVNRPVEVEQVEEVDEKPRGDDMTRVEATNVQAQFEARQQERDVVRDLYNRISQMDFTQRLNPEQVEMVARYLAIKEVGY
jgi:hypothetical protein